MRRVAGGWVVLALSLGCGPGLGPGGEDAAEALGTARQEIVARPPLRMMTYNIRRGADSSLADLAAVIRSQAPDLVALQEVDLGTQRSGGADQPAQLSQLTGMSVSFVPSLLSFDGGQYGLALLSRYPIRSATRHALRSSAEQRILALFEVELDSRVLPVGVTHLASSGAAERLEQAQDVRALLAARGDAVLMGDFNDTPSGSAYQELRALLDDGWLRGASGNGFTSPAYFPIKRIDYLMLGKDFRGEARLSVVNAGSQSDHRPVVGTVELPGDQTLLGLRTPNRAVEQDSRAVGLGVQLRFARNGLVHGLRFYRGARNPNGYRVALWSSGGQLLASEQVTDGTVPGWQEVTLSTPVAVSAGPTYVASYFTSNGLFARDPYAFESGAQRGDLSAPAGAGVYRYSSAPVFPDRTYRETNYWVDARFVASP
jgi:endonuclease/exonuclease/phosphatase family metal-dependent hydrolase